MAKKYYWLQLKEDFFRQKEIKLLRKIAGGDTYTIIYLKMMLMSLKDEGKILYEGVGSTFAEEVALDIDEDIENVQITINFLLSKGLMQVSEFEGFMSDVPSLIGSETDSARRVRKHRELKEKKKKALQSNGKALQSNGDVTKGNTEIEIELEQEKELEQQQEKEPPSAAGESENNFVRAWEKAGFGMMSSFVMEDLEHWVKDFGGNEDVIIAAIKEAAENTPDKPFKYVEGILKGWYKRGIRSVSDIEAEKEKWKQGRKQTLEETQKKGENSYGGIVF